VVFRRLWRIPLSGFGVLLRKAVMNEVVFGYSGEAYFYAWARSRADFGAAPFAAIRDVNILSALAGNAATLLMIALSAAMLDHTSFGHIFGAALWSAAAIIAYSLLLGLLAHRVFALGGRELRFVAWVQLGRTLACTALTILLWRLVSPTTPLAVWIALAALRLLVSRLPFVANKDLLFATLAALLGGTPQGIGALMAALAVMTLLTHLTVIAAQLGVEASGVFPMRQVTRRLRA
jgi:hypothetical protein